MDYDDPQMERLWQWMMHEDNLFSARANIFMASQALLFSAMALKTGNTGSSEIVGVLSVIGIAFSVMWLYLWWYQTKKVLTPIKNILIGKTSDNYYAEFKHVKKLSNELLGAHTVLGCILPIIIIILWGYGICKFG